MKKSAIIWRESVYKNHFLCNLCGTKLADENGEPCGRTFVNQIFGMIQCPHCRNVVARIEVIEAPEGMTGLQGNFYEFRKGEKT